MVREALQILARWRPKTGLGIWRILLVGLAITTTLGAGAATGAPTFEISFSPDAPRAGEVVTFTYTGGLGTPIRKLKWYISTIDEDGISSWFGPTAARWGPLLYIPSNEYIFPQPGRYGVRLVVYYAERVLDRYGNLTYSFSETSTGVTKELVVLPAVVDCVSPVLEETFATSALSWCAGKDAEHEYATVDGEYKIAAAKPLCWGCNVPSLGDSVRDFILDVDLRVASGTGGVGVAFRGTNSWNPRYTVDIGGDGAYSLYRRDSNEVDVFLVPRTVFPELRRSPSWNHLTIAAKGSTILVFLNHFLAARLQDGSIEKGLIRLMTCGTESGTTDGRFDNLTVRVCDDLVLPEAPTASFTFSPSAPNTSTSVRFDASGSADPDGTVASYAWDFGDSTSSSAAGSATHTYSRVGWFQVTLTVTDNEGWKASKTLRVEVKSANQIPTASFTWQVLSSSGARLLVEPRTGDRISFDASASLDPDGNIANYAWDWESDGTYDATSSVPTAEHTFSASGSHRVTLRVTDDKGATAPVTKTIGIGVRQTPQASFSFAPSQPSILDEVRFSDASTDPDGQISSWSWEFGDGTSSTERDPARTYSRKGTFTVKLTVTDNDGLTGTKSQALTVMNVPPDASFTFEPQIPVVGQSVRFDGTASTDRDGTLSSYAWDFDGDGKVDATGATVAHTFTAGGPFTVTLTVTDSDGATAKQGKTITVAAVPPGPPRFPQQWAVVIGVGNYEDPAISDLTYTEADAQAFYGFLTSTQGGGLQKDHVRFLLNAEATTASVKAAFRWLISQAGAEDLVVIYFAGHGGTGEDLTVPPDEADGVDEYLVTYDAQQADLFSTAVRDDEMADWLASFQSDHVVVILDSCFAAGATRSLEQTGTRAGPGNRVFNDLVGPGRLFLAASQEAELSYEDPALGHGVFTYYLLRGLGAMEGVTTPEADADHDGRVTVEELRIYLEREVTRARPQQHPLVTGDLTLERVALSGYGEPLLGEVTALDGDRVMISLGTRHGVQPGDRFEVVGVYALPDGTTMRETRAMIEVTYMLGPDRSACVLIESHFPVEIGDSVRPAQ